MRNITWFPDNHLCCRPREHRVWDYCDSHRSTVV
jgi:hypothetical protein